MNKIMTQDELDAFARNNGLSGLMLTEELGSLGVGCSISVLTDRQLRQMAAGAPTSVPRVWGPLNEVDVDRLKKKHPYCIVRYH